VSATILNLSEPRLQAVMQAALGHVAQTVTVVADRVLEQLGTTALQATSGKQRDACLGAQVDLRRKLPQFHAAFNETLTQKVQQEVRPRGAARGTAAPTDWQSLSLVDDKQVEELVSADRLSQAIAAECEWELRELDGYFGSLLRSGTSDKERNPLRPDVLGKALFRAIEAASADDEARKLLAAEFGRGLGPALRVCYAEITADLRSRGVQPLGLSVKTTEGPAHDAARSTHSPQAAQFEETLGLPSDSVNAPFTASGSGTISTRSGAPSTRNSGTGGGGGSTAGSGPARLPGGTPFGSVDVQMMSLMRRLAYLGNLPTDFQGSGSGQLGGDAANGLMAANVIRAHRDELRQASSGALDHMVIDVVGSLFDQILSDPKVPPQMARQIARLQVPVLRVALGDSTFFSSRRHPVRRFVNRIASLACAFDDFAEPPGSTFLERVRALVQDIVSGDFDQMEVYDGKLADLENFIAEQTHAEVQQAAGGGAPAMLDSKEDELRLQQRYMQQLQIALAPVAMPDFMREFLTQVWSQAIVQAVRKQPDPAVGARMRRAARDLVMSIQPKGAPAQRKAFLLGLPALMKDLNDGVAAVGWPDSAKKTFFARLMPAHAESLKGGVMRELDHNLLVKQLEGIFNAALPRPEDLRRGDAVPVLDDVVVEHQFSAAEKEQVGLVDETAIDWDGTVDIEIGAEPELSAADIDINIDGLPPAEAPDPTRGAELIDHIQLGFAYQMHLSGRWEKVRLSYVSPGRAFFVFTRGKKHQQTISMTQRMLTRMCDTGRLRAFENAYLIERATARARKQLAELGVKATQPAKLH
jgi:hypothetical protein